MPDAKRIQSCLALPCSCSPAWLRCWRAARRSSGGASALATRTGIPPLLVGLTVVAFGTSAPELVVTVMSALQNVSDLAYGNVVGSNIANIGLVLAVSALIAPVTMQGPARQA